MLKRLLRGIATWENRIIFLWMGMLKRWNLKKHMNGPEDATGSRNRLRRGRKIHNLKFLRNNKNEKVYISTFLVTLYDCSGIC